MKVVNFVLILIAVVIVVAILAVGMRGMSWSRHARSDWNSWAVSETANAVILDSKDVITTITVCNSSFRRSAEPHDVVVRVGAGDAAEEFPLPYRGCTTLRAARVEIVKPAGAGFAASGRYKLERSRGFAGPRFEMPAPPPQGGEPAPTP